MFQLLPLGKQLLSQTQAFIQKRQAAVHVQQQQQPTQYSPIQDFDLQDSPVLKKKNKPRKT